MIRVEGLRKTFGDVVAVDDVSLVAEDGRITGLLGPNGAGKTTTLRALTGLLEPDRGRLEIDGNDVRGDAVAARARLGVLPDAHGLYARLTPREHFRYFGTLQGLAGRELEARIDGLVDLLDLKEVADRRTDGFSQGERMKVSLGRALVHDPPNVVLDEPTNGLDVMSTRAVRQLVRRLREEGRCVLFSSHVMQEVAALCDTIVIVARGKVAAHGTPAELCAATGQSELEDAFVHVIGTEEGLV